MRYLNLLTLIIFFLHSFNTFAQTPHQIEADLLKSFKNIDYWDQQRDKDTSFSWVQKLSQANHDFAQKLQFYAQKYPATIKYPFNALVKEHLDISSSTDGLFRIYSWDTETGGTMHFFENVMQYKSGAATKAIIDTPKQEGDSRPNFRKMYTVRANDKTYYLGVFLFIESSRYYGEGITIFSVTNGKLNDDVKLIKTDKGILGTLIYEYDFVSVFNWKIRPEISFDERSKTIRLPLVKADGKVTHQYITYKFTGQYFERIKN